MIEIDISRCVGCGLCVGDCFPGVLELKERSATVCAPQNCIGCGHCIAVCPHEAVRDSNGALSKPLPVKKEVRSDALLRLMQSRRSCRQFKPDPVPRELIQILVTASSVCPTAKNLQATRYIAVTEQIPTLLTAALESLGDLGKAMLDSEKDPGELRRANNFVRWQKEHQKDPTYDPLFFHAPLLLMFVSEAATARDAASGAAYTELMAASLGLGCLYSGYFTACAAISPEIQKILRLEPQEQVVRCLVLGYPSIRYVRTAPRKLPNMEEL